MKQFYILFRYIFIIVWLNTTGCKSQTNPKSEPVDDRDVKQYVDWSINTEYLLQGCEGGPDCIKSLDHPKFISVNATQYLADSDLIIGLKMHGDIKCYPHAILDWHEIINDSINGKNIAINYCPLTGSGMAWNRMVNGKKTSFGVSGLLFNSNIIPYDRETESFWSQMKMQCVNGELYKQAPEVYQVIETTWATWKAMFPTSEVLSTETGFSRDYGAYPYGTYKQDMDVYFPTEFDDEKIHPKERVFGIADGKHATCYRFASFQKNISLLNDTISGGKVLVVGSKDLNFIVAFEHNDTHTFSPVVNALPAIIKDENNAMYDVFGYCINNNSVPALKPVTGFIAYWFAWAAFYPELRLYK